MTCSICQAPAYHLYAEGPELAAFCSLCDRIGAEDEPMESARSVYLGGLALLVLILLPAIWAAIV